MLEFGERIVCDFCGAKTEWLTAAPPNLLERPEGWINYAGPSLGINRDDHDLCPVCVKKIKAFGMVHLHEFLKEKERNHAEEAR